MANVIVAVIGAGAVFVLGWQANQLGKKANEIADMPRKLAQEAEDKEAEVLLVYITGDVESCLKRAQALAADLVTPGCDTLYVGSEQKRGEVQHHVSNLLMHSVEASRARLHVLDRNVSHALARSIGIQRMLSYRLISHQNTLPVGSDRGREFLFLQQWLNVMILDLEIVHAHTDSAMRFGSPPFPDGGDGP